jgi:hypothetical protein
MDQDDDNDNGAHEEKDIVVLKAPLAKILRDPRHVEIYQNRVNSINRVVTTAYLLSRYIFVHSYEDNPNFNVDIYISTDFFCEVLRALQTRTRRKSTLESTIRNRRLIDHYITEFCILYQYRLVTIEGIASNLEAYIGRQMATSYINNAEFKSGQHFRAVLNIFFDVKDVRATFRRQTSTDNEKKLARAYLADISSFKDIISTASTYGEIEARWDELDGLGSNYIEAFIFFAPWLEQVGKGTYRKGSLWYELAASKSVHSLYQLATLNSALPHVVGRPSARWQPFPLRHTFIPRYVMFDLGMVASHILLLRSKEVKHHYSAPTIFWDNHFRTNIRPFRQGSNMRVFDGTFVTDGYGVSIIKRRDAARKGAGRKRKRGKKRQVRDAELFPFFHTIQRSDLQNYRDVVFIDPNIRDTLYMMHKDSTPDNPRLARYTSMTRRRHLGTNIERDRIERFIKQQNNVDEIRLHHENLSYTNSHSISSADYDIYCSRRGEAKQTLGPMYEQLIFRKMRWRTSIGKQRDMMFLSNLIRRKFGQQPLIILGDKSTSRNRRFHAPTQGVGLRYQLYRLGFRVLLLDEYRTSSSCPVCFANINKRCLKRQSPRPWRRNFGEQWVHGLVECNSDTCKAECGYETKKWNRDLLAVSNFRRIWNAYINGQERPDDLKPKRRENGITGEDNTANDN